MANEKMWLSACMVLAFYIPKDAIFVTRDHVTWRSHPDPACCDKEGSEMNIQHTHTHQQTYFLAFFSSESFCLVFISQSPCARSPMRSSCDISHLVNMADMTSLNTYPHTQDSARNTLSVTTQDPATQLNHPYSSSTHFPSAYPPHPTKIAPSKVFNLVDIAYPESYMRTQLLPQAPSYIRPQPQRVWKESLSLPMYEGNAPVIGRLDEEDGDEGSVVQSVEVDEFQHVRHEGEGRERQARECEIRGRGLKRRFSESDPDVDGKVGRAAEGKGGVWKKSRSST